MAFQFISDTLIFLLTLCVSCWIMVWNKALFCLEVLIYERL